MLTRTHGAPLCAALVIACAGCVVDDTGTYCRYDYQCMSNSCTWYSCDDPLVAAIFRAGKDHDDEAEESTKPAPKPAGETHPPPCPWLCEVLTSESRCSEAAGCHVEWECTRDLICSGADCFTASCSDMDADHCQAPCFRQVRCVGKREC